jgi:polyhydroxyalkanoate synthesis regulator phasin
MSKWFKVFKKGKHTDSLGRTREFTNEDIESIAKTYNEQSDHQAPLCKGHPSDNQPAFGWVDKLKAEGGALFASFKDIAKELVQESREGKYKFPSISLYSNGLLRHIATLGAVPPAIKGLDQLVFAEEDANGEVMTFSFNEELEGKGFDTFDSDKEKQSESSQFAERISSLEKQLADKQKIVDDLKAIEADNAKLKEQLQFAEDEQLKARTDLDKLRFAGQILQFHTYLKEKVAYSELVPAIKNKVMKILAVLDTMQYSEMDANSFDYAEGQLIEPAATFIKEFKDEFVKDGKISLPDIKTMFMDFLTSLTPHIKTPDTKEVHMNHSENQISNEQLIAKTQQIVDRARKEGKNMSFSESYLLAKKELIK